MKKIIAILIILLMAFSPLNLVNANINTIPQLTIDNLPFPNILFDLKFNPIINSSQLYNVLNRWQQMVYYPPEPVEPGDMAPVNPWGEYCNEYQTVRVLFYTNPRVECVLQAPPYETGHNNKTGQSYVETTKGNSSSTSNKTGSKEGHAVKVSERATAYGAGMGMDEERSWDTEKFREYITTESEETTSKLITQNEDVVVIIYDLYELVLYNDQVHEADDPPKLRKHAFAITNNLGTGVCPVTLKDFNKNPPRYGLYYRINEFNSTPGDPTTYEPLKPEEEGRLIGVDGFSPEKTLRYGINREIKDGDGSTNTLAIGGYFQVGFSFMSVETIVGTTITGSTTNYEFNTNSTANFESIKWGGRATGNSGQHKLIVKPILYEQPDRHYMVVKWHVNVLDEIIP
jgi:hypothetical protein